MVNVVSGLDALNMLKDEGGSGGHENKFSSLKSGEPRKVKILSMGDFIGVHTYSIFKQVNTFVPENLAKLSANGYPVENLTPFDLAWKYHKDLSEEFGDDHSKAASNYRLKPRFAFGFYDLDTKECIVIDFSKAQGQALYQTMQKQEKKFGKKAFELEKSGSGTSTKVSLIAEDLEDLTDAQQKAFEEAPAEFDKTLFDNLYFVRDEAAQIEALTQAGFDVSLIGYSANTKPQQEGIPADANPLANEEDPTQNF